MPDPVASELSLPYRFGQWWEFLLDLFAVMRPMRFPIVVLVATSILLIVVQPAQDALLVMVANATDEESGQRAAGFGRFALFLMCWFYWAFSTFYAARFMSRLPPRGRIAYLDALAEGPVNPFHIYPPPRLRTTHVQKLNVTVPRALGGTVIVATAIALIRSVWGTHNRLAWVLVVGASLALFVVYIVVVRGRRAALNGVARRLSMQGRVRSLTYDIPALLDWPPWCMPLILTTGVFVLVAFCASAWCDLAFVPRGIMTTILIAGAAACLGVLLVVLHSWRGIPHGTKWFVAALLSLTTSLFMFSLWPNAPIAVQWLRSPVVVVLAAAGWAATGTFLLALPAEITGFPILSFLFVFAILSSLVSLRDNHMLRLTEPPSASYSAAERKFAPLPADGCPSLAPPSDELTLAFARWCAVAIAHRRPGRALPLVIVATAGGASRAAYWTMVVLSRLESADPNFHDDVFAISSVSGGTLGSAVYRLSLDLSKPAAERQYPLLQMLKQDFLSSLLLGAAYADLIQRVLPGSLLPDRAAALETAWEVQWARLARTSFPDNHAENWMRDGFAMRMNSFMHRTAPPQWRPIMLFNGTSVATGRRIITSNMPIGPGFPVAYDFYDGWGTRDIRVSTAIHNSARFPYLDAAGDIPRGSIATADRIVDGGYFENNGAATAVDLLEQLIDRGAFRGDGGIAIMPVVIQITNDPQSPNAKPLDAPTAPPPRPDWHDRVLADATVPVIGFYDIRSGLGERATEALRRRLAYFQPRTTSPAPPDDSRYFNFGIWDKAIPMSWLLSDTASIEIERELPTEQLGTACNPDMPATAACNGTRLQFLLTLLRDGVPIPAADAETQAPTSSRASSP